MKAVKVRICLAVSVVLALLAAIQTTGSAQTEVANVPVVTGAGNTTQIAASSKRLAWSQVPAGRSNHSNLYVKNRGGERFRLNPTGTQASLGGFDGDQLIYQIFDGNV